MISLKSNVATHRLEQRPQHISKCLRIIDGPAVPVSKQGFTELFRCAIILKVLGFKSRNNLAAIFPLCEGGEDNLFFESVAFAQ